MNNALKGYMVPGKKEKSFVTDKEFAKLWRDWDGKAKDSFALVALHRGMSVLEHLIKKEGDITELGKKIIGFMEKSRERGYTPLKQNNLLAAIGHLVKSIEETGAWMELINRCADSGIGEYDVLGGISLAENMINKGGAAAKVAPNALIRLAETWIGEGMNPRV